VANPPKDSVISTPGHGIGVETGDGGFDVGDGVTRTYEPRDPAAEPTTKPRDRVIDVSFTTNGVPNDLPKKTIETLGSYLVKLTAKNKYPVSPIDQTTSYADVNADSPRVHAGYAFVQETTNVPSMESQTGTGKKFANDSRQFLRPQPYLIRPQPNTEVGEPNFRDASSEPEGNYVTEAIAKSGRWSSVNSFSSNFMAGAPSDPQSSLIVDRELGDNVFGKKLKRQALTSRFVALGAGLTQVATGELAAQLPLFDPNDPNTIFANKTVPGLEQLTAANSIKTAVLQAQAVFDKADRLPSDPTYLSINDVTWGQLNNVDDNFTGQGMWLLALAQFAVVKLAVAAVGAVLGLITKSADAASFLGLTQTDRVSYSDAVDYGFNIFFAGYENPTVDKAIASFLAPFKNDNGFRVVHFRVLIRSAILLVEKLSALIGGGLGLVTNIFEIVSAIKTSHLFATLNAFAKIGDLYAYLQVIGDISLKDDRGFIIPGDESSVTPADSVKLRADALLSVAGLTGHSKKITRYKLGSFEEAAPDDVKDNRESEMSVRRKVSILMPVVKLGDLKLGVNVPPTSAFDASPDSVDENFRVKTGVVSTLESFLESEYFPFYFHDLRTNEIVSFHAFLASLTDSYTASYDSVEGMGRVEPVKHYKGTTRKFGFSFYVVATNEDQVSPMYDKINKLTTLLYPQYTSGKVVFQNQKRFVQPFSQLIGASPLVRIRLGDIARSNYSKFALARLFGAGTGSDKFNIDGNTEIKPVPPENLVYYYEPQNSGQPVAVSTQDGGGPIDYISPTGWSITITGGTTGVVINSANGLEYVEYVTGKLKMKEGFREGPLAKFKGRNPGKFRTATVKKFDGETVFIKKSYLTQTVTVINAKDVSEVKSYNTTADISNSLSISNMLDPTTSAIVRHFEHNSGKGLAGHIDQMDFDWYSNTRWNTGDQGRSNGFVPMMCKVTVNFSPVHDISPGLDSQGYNRAPIYPRPPTPAPRSGIIRDVPF